MEKEDLIAYKEKLSKLTEEERKLRDLHLKKFSTGDIQGPATGYASIDKPWLKYYHEEEIMCSLPNMTAYDYLRILNMNNLENIALNCMGKEISYRKLFENIELATKALNRLSIDKDDIVTIMLPSIPEEVYLFYGVDKIGASANFVIPGTPIDKVCANMRELNSKNLFIFDQFLDGADYIKENTNLKNIVSISIEHSIERDGIINWANLLDKSKNDDYVVSKRMQDDVLFVAKTGGTTGIPKSVLITDRSFNNVVHQYLNSSLNYSAGDRWLRLWPIFHATSMISGNHLPLCAGMEIITDPNFCYEKIDEIIMQYKPNHILLVPPLLEIFINSPLINNEDISFIKTIGCGGTGMTEDLEYRANLFFKKHNIDIFLGCGYGLTENSSVATVRMNEETCLRGSVGVPLIDTSIGIFDVETGEEVNYNEEGEICIKSSNFMKGYLNDKQLTESVIKQHEDGTRWIHTSDIGYITQDGFVYVKGRITRTIFLHTAEKVYPSNLENIISKVIGVKDVSVIAISDEQNEGFKVPACCIVCEDGYTENEITEIVTKYCEEKVEKYAIPRKLFFVKELPFTKLGKVDVKQLEKKYH